MKRLVSFIILCAALLFSACRSAVDDLDDSDDKTLLVNLDISVALSDVSDVLTRAPEDVADNEKMQSLRVVIVRPNWTVEANRKIDLKAAATLQHQVISPFKVVANERKLIYLFVNEETTATDNTTNITQKLVKYDLDEIKVGGYFPVTDINSLKIRLEGNNQQIKGALPMSEKHYVEVNEDPKQSCNLFVTRAAVKFTFHILNNSNKTITLDGLSIDKMAREEWYMPRAEYADPKDNPKGEREIIAYEVPAGVGYYTYEEEQFAQTVKLDAKKDVTFEPIYLLEGKYTERPDMVNSENNYSIKMSINNFQKEHYLTNLPTLPRNTHVKVNITFNSTTEINCVVDVIPYSGVELEPDFGL